MNQLLKVLQWQFCNFIIISMFISWHSAVRKKFLFLLIAFLHANRFLHYSMDYCSLLSSLFCCLNYTFGQVQLFKMAFSYFWHNPFFFKDFLPFWHAHTHLVLILFQHWNQLFPQSLVLIGKSYLATKISELKCIVLHYWNNCLWATLEERTR